MIVAQNQRDAELMGLRIDFGLFRARSMTGSSQSKGDVGPIYLRALSLTTPIAENLWVMDSMQFDWGNLSYLCPQLGIWKNFLSSYEASYFARKSLGLPRTTVFYTS